MIDHRLATALRVIHELEPLDLVALDPYDKNNAEWILTHFKEWGLDAHIERFDVLFPTPKLRVVEMLVDCDDDTVLLKVTRLGDGNVCHTGERSCFYRKVA